MTATSIWRNSPRDAFLVFWSVVEASLKVYLVLSLSEMSAGAAIGLTFALILLNCMNYECAGHYFIHTPFFRSKALNSAFGVLNSIAFGFQQTLYRAEHINHHRYGSDYRDPLTGTTKDGSSIYRYGAGGSEPEPIWRYAILSPIRQPAMELVRGTPARLRRQLLIETCAVGLFLAWAALANWQAFLLLLFISWAGSAVSHVQNWLKHAHAVPGSRLSDSVSSYGGLYNRVWFNNGYHQEHHSCPSAHWTKLPDLKEGMLPSNKRRVVPYAHLWNFQARYSIRA